MPKYLVTEEQMDAIVKLVAGAGAAAEMMIEGAMPNVGARLMQRAKDVEALLYEAEPAGSVEPKA